MEEVGGGEGRGDTRVSAHRHRDWRGEITRQQRDVQSRPGTHMEDRHRAMQPVLLHSGEALSR